MKRDEFNRLLLSAYAGKEPVYDLAKAESTYPSGTRSEMTSDSRDFYTLAPDYTDDGEHLNETGRQAAASELLHVLAAASSGKLP